MLHQQLPLTDRKALQRPGHGKDNMEPKHTDNCTDITKMIERKKRKRGKERVVGKLDTSTGTLAKQPTNWGLVLLIIP